jgi:heme exporter protein D
VSFGSFGEFLAMGGHGLYVWLSYGATLIIVLYNVLSVQVRQRRFFRQARDLERRNAARARVAGSGPADAADASAIVDRGESVRP